jgi:hypothetical protein
VSPATGTAPTVVTTPAPSLPRPRSALGALLVGLVAAGWASAVPYLVVRAGAGSPVGLAAADTAHVGIGLALAAVLAVKVLAPRRGRGAETAPEPWWRWVSVGAGLAYGAVVATGLGALAPLSAPAREAWGEVHLIVAAWALAPTAAHAWAYRRRLSGLWWRSGRRARRAALALGLLAAAVAGVAAGHPRAASAWARAGAGGSWARASPRVFLDRLVVLGPPGSPLLAGGAGLFLGTGGRFRRLGPFSWSELVLGLATGPGRRVWVGTTSGLWQAPAPTGPYRRVASFPSGVVHAVAPDPRGAGLWASSRGGFFYSPDGGRQWLSRDRGVGQPDTVWALAFWDGSLYGSDASAVYRWTGHSWVTSSHQFGVVSLDASPGGLLASSMGDGLRRLSGGRWLPAGAGLPAHAHAGLRGTHVVSVTAQGQRAWAGTMVDGAAASTDGGNSFTLAWPQLGASGVVWRVQPAGPDRLVAATDSGLYSYRLPPGLPAGPGWWALVAAAGLGGGSASAAAWRRLG